MLNTNVKTKTGFCSDFPVMQKRCGKVKVTSLVCYNLYKKAMAKKNRQMVPGVTKLISMLFFGDINWAKLIVLLK